MCWYVLVERNLVERNSSIQSRGAKPYICYVAMGPALTWTIVATSVFVAAKIAKNMRGYAAADADE